MFRTSRTREATKQMWKILIKHKIGFLEVKCSKFLKPKNQKKHETQILVLLEVKYGKYERTKTIFRDFLYFPHLTKNNVLGFL